MQGRFACPPVNTVNKVNKVKAANSRGPPRPCGFSHKVHLNPAKGGRLEDYPRISSARRVFRANFPRKTKKTGSLLAKKLP